MSKRAVVTLLLLLFAAEILSAQTDRAVTVTVSRSVNVAPDQVTFVISVFTPTDGSRDDALAALKAAGMTVANFNSVTTNTQYDGTSYQNVLQWTFLLTVPLPNLKTTASQLAGLQQAVAKQKNGISVSFSVNGLSVSPQASAAQPCATADLIGDARAQAQKMATAAGAAVGAVVAVSGFSSAIVPSDSLFSSPLYLPPCVLTVKFALTGF